MGAYAIPPHYELPAKYDRYYGSKAGEGVYQTLINEMPPHQVYCEPFLGSGAVFRKKLLAQTSFLGELDLDLILAHSYALAATQTNENALLGISDAHAMSKTNGANYAGLVVAAGLAVARNVRLAAGVQLLNYDWKYTVEAAVARMKAYEPNLSLLTYFDPPYPQILRKSDTRYKYEMSEEQHKEFLRYVKKMPGMVMVSTYPNHLYKRELKDWRLVEFTAKTSTGVATEWLFCNFPEPTAQHDSRYLGNDYRIRENIASRKKTIIGAFEAMPTLQRQMMLETLLDAVPSMPYQPMPVSKEKQKAQPVELDDLETPGPLFDTPPGKGISVLLSDKTPVADLTEQDRTVASQRRKRDEAVVMVEGFDFNENRVCLNPEKIHVYGPTGWKETCVLLAQHPTGWAYGYHLAYGSGSHSSPVMYGERWTSYPSRQEALTAVLDEMEVYCQNRAADPLLYKSDLRTIRALLRHIKALRTLTPLPTQTPVVASSENNPGDVPEEQPVVATSELPVDPSVAYLDFYQPLPVDQVYVDQECRICSKRKGITRKLDAPKFAAWGWQDKVDGYYVNTRWLCSITCTEAALKQDELPAN